MADKSVNATHYEFIPTFARGAKRRDHVVNAVVETPKGSCKKYALEPSLGIIAFHNHLPAKFEWPYDYGFIPRTLAPDGDGVDVLILDDKGLFSGCLIAVRVIGAVLERKDGVQDDRTIAVPLPTPGVPQPTDGYRDIEDVPKRELEHIMKFLGEYPEIEGHKVEIAGVADARAAMKNIKAAMKTFKKEKGK